MRNETEKKDKISREKKERGAGHREAFPVTAPLFSVKKWEQSSTKRVSGFIKSYKSYRRKIERL